MATVSSGYKYALDGPPFNFLGHMCETQKSTFWAWLDKRTPWHPEISQWYSIRSHQLRKTAGLLEEFYKKQYPSLEAQELTPTFQKAEWKPDKGGHYTYVYRSDQAPSVMVSRIKDRYKHMLQRDDEGVFWMNWLRTQIELTEDKALFHAEAKGTVTQLKAEVDQMFEQPEFDGVLVKNKTKLFEGEPYFRVNQLDPPTKWERRQHGHSGSSDAVSSMLETSGDL